MPYIHTADTDNATALQLQALQRLKTPTNRNPRRAMDILAPKALLSLRDELRLHASWIRDTLAPILSRNSRLTNSDNVLLRSVLRTLESTQITLDLLRYSRIEKALMVIAATGTSMWPIDTVVQAEELIQKWEDELGPLKNLRSDLYGPGGRLEGVRKITDGRKGSIYKIEDQSKSAWSVNVIDPYKSHAHGSLGFEVGDWWIKPAAAYRDGIIDKTAYPITADEHGAYAIVVSGSQEIDLRPDDTFVYHAALDDPGAFKLTKTMTSDTEKIVRVLRSWKLRSKLAPKAGLRYDGLYRIQSFGIKLLPPNSWHKTFTLSRILDQAPMDTALAYPLSDQLDDWHDYQRSKNVDRGEDFAMLHEILRQPSADMKKELGGEAMERMDSGYFSRRSSKLSSRVSSIPNTRPEDHDQVAFGDSTRNSSRRNSMLIDQTETEFTLVAEGTPSTPDREPRPVQSTDLASALDGAQNLSDSTTAVSDLDRARWNSNPSSLGDDERRTRHSLAEAASMRSRRRSNVEHHQSHRPRWYSEWGVWRSSGAGFDGVEEGEFVDWVARRASGMEEIEEIAPEDGPRRRSVETVRRVESFLWGDEGGDGSCGEIGRKDRSDGQGVEVRDFAEEEMMGDGGKRLQDEEDTKTQNASSGGTSVDTVIQGEEEARRRWLAVRE